MRLRPCTGHPIRQLADSCTDLRAVVLVGLIWAALVGVANAGQTSSPTVNLFNGAFDYSSAKPWITSGGQLVFESCSPSAVCWAQVENENSQQKTVKCEQNAKCLIDMNDKEGSKEWTITVAATAELVVRCAANEGCVKLKVTCHGTCTVDCSGDTTCKELGMTCVTGTKTTAGTLTTCRC